ncbi:hypothetical protein [Nostoc sp.]|uniref:hypothetical protein n=1 Tax=Nostoc sp. TaxID=1180 RepID=UPI002FF4D2A4
MSYCCFVQVSLFSYPLKYLSPNILAIPEVITEYGRCAGFSWRGYANAYALWRFGDRLADKIRLGNTK